MSKDTAVITGKKGQTQRELCFAILPHYKYTYFNSDYY